MKLVKETQVIGNVSGLGRDAALRAIRRSGGFIHACNV